MASRVAVVIANGRFSPLTDLRARLRRADLLICADGGLRIARRAGVAPQIAVGDFDSAQPALLRWAASRRVRLFRHPVEKDKTDTELALDAAVEEGATEVEFMGVLGGRLDHALANIALLVQAKAKNVSAKIVDGQRELFLAQSETRVPGRRGDRVSLIPMTPRVTGITLTGFRYLLKNAAVRQGSTRMISNVIASPPALVRVKHGHLLIVIIHR